jgi:hypothetical protein
LITTNLNKEYTDTYNRIGNYTNYWRDWATRYLMIYNYYPSAITYPQIDILVYNDKSYIVTTNNNKFILRYQYDTYKFDEFSYGTVPIVKLKYRNELNNQDFIINPLLNIYFGMNITYDKELKQVIDTFNIGYCFKFGDGWIRNITFVPSFGFNIYPIYYDIFLHVGYNIYNNINVGIGISILRQNLGIFIGVNL